MAKKNETLTLEKRLQAALVPDWEWPYRVPENWVWTYLITGAAECLDTLRKPVNATERASRNGDIPYYGATGQVGWIDDYLIDEELVLLGEDGAPFLEYVKDKAYIIAGKAWVNNHAHILRSYYGSTGNIYLKNYLNIFNFRNYVNGTTRLKLTQASMNMMPFPLPPLSEQQRIVDRIERLFQKLDHAKELVQSALDGLETRKAAILHQAFTGELTANWRTENGVSANSRFSAALSDVCSSFQYGTAKKSESSGEIAVVRMGNLQDGEIDWNNLVYSNDKEDNEKYLLKNGDVLFNRTNSPALVGKTSIYRGNIPAIFAGYLIRINYSNALLGNYLNYMLNTTQAKEYCSLVKTDGVNQSNINAKKLGAFILPVPSIPEQAEIVRILDSLFEKERRAKELYDIIDKIDLLKKTVLSRAFRGELGTNDSNDESAIELLKECLLENDDVNDKPQKAKSKAINIPQEIDKQLKSSLEREIYSLLLRKSIAEIKEIMSLNRNTFDVIEALKRLEEKKLVFKHKDGSYSMGWRYADITLENR